MMSGLAYRRALERRRRSLQLRVVATTLVVSAAVVAVVGLLVASQVRDSILSAKVDDSLRVAGEALNSFDTAMSKSSPSEQLTLSSDIRAALQAAADKSGGDRNPVALTGTGSTVIARSVDKSLSPSNVTDNPELRDAVSSKAPGSRAWQYVRIALANGKSESGLVVVQSAAVPTLASATSPGEYRLYVFFPLDAQAKVLTLVQRTLLLGGIGLILLFGGIAWLVTRQIVQPVQHTARIAEMLAAGRLQERLAIRGTDELAKLGLSFNKMADSLQRQIRELEDLSRVQRRFVSDVSHELRTPLTTVRMAADVLHAARGDFPPAVSRSAELLQHELDRFEALLVDLLEISRHDARAAVLEPESVDVCDLVHSVVDLSRSHSTRTECPLELELPPGPVDAEVDARRVQRIVRNLINNALEHGERRPVRVTVAASDDAVAISVRDSGVGLRPGEATLVFNRFWRADAARARSSGGTGLGLAIALEDARLHGGWLQAWGESGVGANFRLTLPRRAGEPLQSSPLPLEPEDVPTPEPDDATPTATSHHPERPALLPVTLRGIGQPRPADPTPPSPEALRG
ncbi:MAG: two-component system, OmpR family, sensor histidine kinase MtrB [Frankiales bacterium]|jgi:two-component system sensor histidine kinase MtrB|nr:two-component system, OmpR family, sensor histidine kinase MtrB [Frankiales bacterium]MDX6211872.1 two-component system, OmpR family, sensor histidine kinase MtrB [Frankiales bacterium]